MAEDNSSIVANDAGSVINNETEARIYRDKIRFTNGRPKFVKLVIREQADLSESIETTQGGNPRLVAGHCRPRKERSNVALPPPPSSKINTTSSGEGRSAVKTHASGNGGDGDGDGGEDDDLPRDRDGSPASPNQKAAIQNSMNTYWIPNADIHKKVITKEIQYYLGPDSEARPYEHEARTLREARAPL
jgi:hypothetical protein